MLLNLYTIIAVISSLILYVALYKTKAEDTELGVLEWVFIIGGAILWPIVLALCIGEFFLFVGDKKDSDLDN